MSRKRLKTILASFTILLTLTIITITSAAAYAFLSLEKEFIEKLESKKFLVPTEYYAAPKTFYLHNVVNISQLEKQFLQQNYRRREFDQRLMPGDYFVADKDQCTSRLQIQLEDETDRCVGWVLSSFPVATADKSIQVIVIQKDNLISHIFRGAPFIEVNEASGDAPLFAQYLGNEPVMQRSVTLSDVPPICLNAIVAIEDAQFLEHKGISLKAISRAFVKNILLRRKAQGGSTITQQLVKNYFLTSERTIKRKAQEVLMSIMLESRFTKDQILETYLNVIYMGQNGAFQLRGYGAASQYYFGKELAQLSLPECSLLAAIVNSPGLFNPFKKPANAIKRRSLVLEKMREQNIISEQEQKSANAAPLPLAPITLASETAPYYLDAVKKQLKELGIPYEGLKIYTALDLEAQDSAQTALKNQLEQLEKQNSYIKKLKEKGQNLEGLILAGDNRTGLVNVVVGGRAFRMTQFNRAIDGHRQVGSIMKPFVYLTALNNKDPDGKWYNPLTPLKDEKFEIKYEGQKWSPDNYGKKYFGTVPMFFALKNSLNAATASLGLQVGLDKIIQITHEMGVTSELKPFPSITLGAFEMYPREVLQSYMTIANFGLKQKISFIRKVINNENNEIFSHKIEPQQVAAKEATATLVGMMKQTVLSGTARSIIANGFRHPTAGKTGTTSDSRDAWFAGFTPYLTTIVWVGYDSNIPHNLTGASGAIPIWTEFMKKTGTQYPAEDFSWPEQTKKITLDEQTLRQMNALGENDPREVELIIDENRSAAD